jgi:hypothetical protein
VPGESPEATAKLQPQACDMDRGVLLLSLYTTWGFAATAIGVNQSPRQLWTDKTPIAFTFHLLNLNA